MGRIVAHLRRNVIAYTALFFAFSGSAYALKGQNTVFSDDIVDGEVKAADLGLNAVTSPKVGPNALTGADINEASLQLNSVNNSASDTGGCSADSQVPTDCASTTINLSRAGRLMVNATGAWHTFNLDDAAGTGSDTDSTSAVAGRCEIRVDGSAIGDDQTMGERSTVASNHPGGNDGTMALTALSGSLPAGNHTVAVFCTETDGDLDWSDLNLTAVRTG